MHVCTCRYRDLLIVCNVQPSSGPVDMDSLLKQANDYKHLMSDAAASRVSQEVLLAESIMYC